MPYGGRPSTSPGSGPPGPQADPPNSNLGETPPANKFVAALQRVRNFAEEEVGQRVVAYGARVESHIQARRVAGPGAGSGSSGVNSASAVSNENRSWRCGKGKGVSANLDAHKHVPGDGTHLGSIRDHTELFTKLRATAIYIRETEEAVRKEDLRKERAAAGGSSSSSPVKDDDLNDDVGRRDEQLPNSTSTSALIESSNTLQKTKRQIENSLLPQYTGFVDSLRAATAKATTAKWTTDTSRGKQLAKEAQADVETHLATLLLVEQELQLALKRLKTAHVICSAINAVDQNCEKEKIVKRNIVHAFALARAENTREFKQARDRVQNLLVGNEAARVVSQQRLLRAADAAYADLERYYSSLCRLKQECEKHAAFRSVQRKQLRNDSINSEITPNDDDAIEPASDEDLVAEREGRRVVLALGAAVAAARGALRAAYEDASLVKRLAGASGLKNDSNDMDSSPFGSPHVGDNSWRAHIASLDAELARFSGEDVDDTFTASISFRESITGPLVLPEWAVKDDERDDEKEKDDTKSKNPITGLGNARRAREAAAKASVRYNTRIELRKTCATAATEYARGALRNAVDAVEDVTRACAAHASAVAKSSEAEAARASKASTPTVSTKLVSTPATTPATPATPLPVPQTPTTAQKKSPTYPDVPRDVGSEIVGLGRLGSSKRKGKPPSTPHSSVAAGVNSTPSVTPPATPTASLQREKQVTPSFLTSGFTRTSLSLVPVKEKTAGLFLALQGVGCGYANESAMGKQSETDGSSVNARPGDSTTTEGQTKTGWFSRRANLAARSASGASDAVESVVAVVGPFAKLKLWAKNKTLRNQSQRHERTTRYDEIGRKYRGRDETRESE